nr:extensin-like [Aegilops tauschii subsp. strangulata]
MESNRRFLRQEQAETNTLFDKVEAKMEVEAEEEPELHLRPLPTDTPPHEISPLSPDWIGIEEEAIAVALDTAAAWTSPEHFPAGPLPLLPCAGRPRRSSPRSLPRPRHPAPREDPPPSPLPHAPPVRARTRPPWPCPATAHAPPPHLLPQLRPASPRSAPSRTPAPGRQPAPPRPPPSLWTPRPAPVVASPRPPPVPSLRPPSPTVARTCHSRPHLPTAGRARHNRAGRVVAPLGSHPPARSGFPAARLGPLSRHLPWSPPGYPPPRRVCSGRPCPPGRVDSAHRCHGSPPPCLAGARWCVPSPVASGMGAHGHARNPARPLRPLAQ